MFVIPAKLVLGLISQKEFIIQLLTSFWVLASADMNTCYESDIYDYCKIILHLREGSNNILHPH